MNRPLRILYVYYGTFGLAGAYVHQLARALSLLDCRATLVVSAYYEFASNADNVCILKLFFPLTEHVPENPYLSRRLLKVLRKPLRYFEQVIGYLKVLAVVIKDNTDVVNLSLIDDRITTFFFFLVLKMLGVKVVITAHDVVPFGHIVLPVLRRYIFAKADAVVLHHAHSVQDLRNLMQPAPRRLFVQTCPLSDYSSILNQAKYQEYLSRIKHETKRYDRVFLFIGTLRREKGIDILVNQWITHMCGDQTSLLLIAGNPTLDIDRLLSSSGQCKNIRWELRRLDDEEFVAYMDSGDIIVTPYHEYANSTIYMAAYIHSRRCVLASNNSLFRSFIDDTNGIMFDLVDPESLGQVLQHCRDLDKEDLSRYAEAGRLKLLASMEQIPEQLAELYGATLVPPDGLGGSAVVAPSD